jgi:hypothetical protein
MAANLPLGWTKPFGLTLLLAAALGGAAGAQSDSVSVAPGPHYAVGGVRRFFMGTGYREPWATPIRVPVADLDRLGGGGLTPLRVGGGATTQTLHLAGANGRRYVLRSVDKTVGQGLTEELRGTLYESILQDQVSAFHPSGAVVLPGLLDAVGVLHTNPQLMVVPDSPRLEEFRAQFAGQLALFEERPDDRREGNPGFHGADRVLGTDQLFRQLRASPKHAVNPEEFLAARLVDLLVGDRDRSVNNWLWARFDTPDGRRYRPIPRDRDQAFIRLDGAIKWYLRFYEPRLVTFAETPPSVTGLSRSAWDMDRPFLVALERAQWDSIVATTKAALSDTVIDRAVARLPREHYAIGGPTLARRLKARRDRLERAADDLHRIVNQAADIHATDEDEIATIAYERDGTLTVSVAPAEAADVPYFRRSFDPAVTREVRLYLLGGDDSVAVVGAGTASITVRVVGGAGRDRFVDQTQAAHAPAFYDGGGGSEFVAGPRTRVRRLTFDPPISWGATAALTPDWGSAVRPIPGVPFRGDLGFFPLAGIAFTRYGFRKEPFLTQHQLKASYATAVSRFLVQYQFDWVVATDRARAALAASWSEVELIRYHGFGNDTDADQPAEFYDVRHDQTSVSPSWALTRGRLGVRVAAHLRHAVTDTSAASLLAADRPYGSGTFTQAGGTVEVLVDTRNDVAAPTRGVRVAARASYNPAVLSVDRGAFGAVDGSVAGYASPFGDRQTLAARVGGRKVWGAFPVHDAAFLGGAETLRGFSRDRFAGDASLFASLEMRSSIARFRFLFPNELGVVGFGEAGRVYVDGRSPGGWHAALGGGLWIAPVARAHTFSVTVARSREYTALYGTTGFAF